MLPSLPVRTVAPTADAVSLIEAKRHLNISHSADDTLIDLLIDAAGSYLDGHAGIMGRALVTQTWKQTHCDFYGGIRLPVGPVASVTSVKYWDQATPSVQQTLSTSVYELRRDNISDYIALKKDQTWPYIANRWDAIEIIWVAGDTTINVPQAIKQAMLLIIGNLYENREESVVGTIAVKIPFGAEMLLAPFRQNIIRDLYLYDDEREHI